MQPSTRPSTLWCVMWSLCELGELVCEPPMEPEPRLTREKQDWSWEEGRGATGGRSGSPGMWIHYKYITITTTSNHCSGAGEEGPNIFCKYCYQISNKIIYITLNTFLHINYSKMDVAFLEFALYITYLTEASGHLSSKLKFSEYWCCPSPGVVQSVQWPL